MPRHPFSFTFRVALDLPSSEERQIKFVRRRPRCSERAFSRSHFPCLTGVWKVPAERMDSRWRILCQGLSEFALSPHSGLRGPLPLYADAWFMCRGFASGSVPPQDWESRRYDVYLDPSLLSFQQPQHLTASEIDKSHVGFLFLPPNRAKTRCLSGVTERQGRPRQCFAPPKALRALEPWHLLSFAMSLSDAKLAAG